MNQRSRNRNDRSDEKGKKLGNFSLNRRGKTKLKRVERNKLIEIGVTTKEAVIVHSYRPAHRHLKPFGKAKKGC